MLVTEGYTVLKQLSEGKISAAYSGVRNVDQQKVILKTTPSDQPTLKDIASIQHEYQILKNLNIPGVPRVVDLIFQQRRPILVIEYISSEPLSKFLQGKPLPLDTFFTIALQLVKIIQSLHAKNIIHKDIKPDNITINPNNLTVQVIDFSISAQMSLSIQESLNPHLLEGTLAYMSPEQTGRSNRNVDFRSDFYSLGVTFYEMLTGSLPFVSKDALQLIYCHLASSPPSMASLNPEVPEQLEALINKLMAKIPEDRYTSIAGLEADLLECSRQWKEKKTISLFPLGLKDIHDHLYISQKLYGRESQIIQLMELFEQTTQGKSNLVFISGYSGIGKSSLVKEIKSKITQQQAYFISGKFEQHQQNVPYSAFMQTFEELIYRLLSESQEKIEKIKRTLLEALGTTAQAIMDVIPTLELIIGPQPPIPELDLKGSQNRFILTFQNFLRALATAEHPLTLFIDDWQWSDNSSQWLLEHLLEGDSLKYILIIGSYRKNEVTEDHLFSMTLRSLEKKKVLINHVDLSPLTEDSIAQLLMDSFNANERVRPLAHLLMIKTQGNPFFINEFLRSLYQKKLLTFNHKKSEWQWDIQSIEQQSFTDNVVEFLVSQIHRLPEDTQRLLEIASCVGYTFNLQVLSAVTQQPIHHINKELWRAVQENFVLPYNDKYKLLEAVAEDDEQTFTLGEKITYQFIHDRVQHAAYSLLSSEDRTKIHLQVGRCLRDSTTDSMIGKHLISVVEHLNLAEQLITDQDERLQIAELNLEASQAIREGNVYEVYSQQGIRFLPADAWDTEYELTFELYYQFTQVEYLHGEVEKAEKNFSLLLTKARAEQQKVRVYLLMSQLYLNKERYKDALQASASALNLLGQPLPLNPSKFQLIKEVIYVQWLLWGKTPEKVLQAPDIQDQKILTILKILEVMRPSAQLLSFLLNALISLRTMSISLRYGNSPYAALGYLGYALMLLGPLRISSWAKQVNTAYAFGQNAIQLSDHYNIPSSRALIYFMYGFMIRFHHNPIKDSLRYLEISHRLATELSMSFLVSGTSNHIATTLLLSGDFLDNVLKATETGLLTIKNMDQTDEKIALTVLQHFCQNLMDGKIAHPWTYKNYGEKRLISYMEKNNYFRAEGCFYLWKSYYYYLLGDYKSALENNKLLERVRGNVPSPSVSLWMMSDFLYPLSLIAVSDDLPENERKQNLKKAKKLLKILKEKAKINPDNYLNKYFLVKAEYTRITQKGRPDLDAYLKSIEIANLQGLLPEEAIAHELLGKVYLKLGDKISGYSHLSSASHGFSIWGAKAKKLQLEELYPQVMRQRAEDREATLNTSLDTSTATDILEEENLDLASLLKVSQAISSEIELEKLLTSLLSILMENATAQRGLLITKVEEDLVVEAESSKDVEKIYLNRNQNIQKRKNIPLTLINYVERTQKPLILQDAGNSKHASLDPYLMEEKPKSILIMPIFYQGKLKNLLYLENNLMSDVFTEKHLHILQFLSSQVTISLENARLYHQATHDYLTGLANRNLLEITFPRRVESSTQQGQIIALLFMDIDGFKTINDTMGHAVGDQLLIKMAKKIKAEIRDSDLAIRLGGDEFVVLLTGLQNKQQVIEVINRLYKSFAKPNIIQGHSIVISSSMGISLYPFDGKDVDALLMKADDALYKVKESGKNNYRFWGGK
jgi:diguanylate cyclase (GGDEF)-like protein